MMRTLFGKELHPDAEEITALELADSDEAARTVGAAYPTTPPSSRVISGSLPSRRVRDPPGTPTADGRADAD